MINRLRRCTAAGLVALVFCAFADAYATDRAPRLLDAVKAGDREAVRAALKQPAALTVTERDGTTALHWAIRADDLEIARMLLRAGADPKAATREGITPLALAAINGSLAATELLLEAGANPNAVLPEGETVLMTAARTGRPEVLKVLLQHGADVKARENWYGESALMWATAENHVDAIKYWSRTVPTSTNARSSSRFRVGAAANQSSRSAVGRR